MKAISITQPWATLIAIGAKRIETRSWHTNYRGVLAIHASKGFPAWARETCTEEPFQSTLRNYGIKQIKDLPLGAIVAVSQLAECFRVDKIPACLLHPPIGAITKNEKYFGDYSDGRFGLILNEVLTLEIPVIIKGQLGLWDVPEFEAESIKAETGYL